MEELTFVESRTSMFGCRLQAPSREDGSASAYCSTGAGGGYEGGKGKGGGAKGEGGELVLISIYISPGHL